MKDRVTKNLETMSSRAARRSLQSIRQATNAKPLKKGSDRQRGIDLCVKWLRRHGFDDLAIQMVRGTMPTKLGQSIDITGFAFGQLTVIELASSAPRRWLCRCTCGVEKIIRGSTLLCGASNSCGCWRSKLRREYNRSHGMAGTRTHRIWVSMLRRSEGRTSLKQRAVYFDRGIRCCARWSSFENFLADMSECPSKKHTLERKDVNGNYEPTNCCWATYPEQVRNRRNSRKITINGETLIVTDWATRKGIKATTIFARLYAGWDERKAVETAVRE